MACLITLLKSYKADCLGDSKGWEACHLHYRAQSWPVGCHSSHGCGVGGAWSSALAVEVEWPSLCRDKPPFFSKSSRRHASWKILEGNGTCHYITKLTLRVLVSTAAKDVVLLDTRRCKYMLPKFARLWILKCDSLLLQNLVESRAKR